MQASLLAVLNESERLLVAETESAALAQLDEDAVGELHGRIRRARNKYIGQYRRAASARVAAKGGRGAARPANRTAALKAEAFEEALSRVSRKLAAQARTAAAKQGAKPAAGKATAKPTARRTVTQKPSGDRALRSPATEKARASTRATGDRRQAKRDSR